MSHETWPITVCLLPCAAAAGGWRDLLREIASLIPAGFSRAWGALPRRVAVLPPSPELVSFVCAYTISLCLYGT